MSSNQGRGRGRVREEEEEERKTMGKVERKTGRWIALWSCADGVGRRERKKRGKGKRNVHLN